MKFASVSTAHGPRYGIMRPDGLQLVSGAWQQRFPSLRHALEGDALNQVAVAEGGEMLPFDGLTYLPVIPNPGKVICVGKNYAAHAAESGDKPASFPNLFARFTETLVGHHQPMILPRLSSDFDYEGELAIIIGKAGRHIPASEALGHIAGYTCFNDGSVRDYQFGHSLLAGKNFAATGAFGPVMVTADEVPDPQALQVLTRVNGELVQHGFTRDMIFDCAALLAYISGFVALAPGDVIATGTPEGVGFAQKPPRWLKPGDRVEVEIPGIGLLGNVIAAELGAAPLV
ncbi:fumarylacetoacetate hydrolase family protein [Devosia sp. Root635]|uniref:fumarylacetoacetate hydrolase family protein n=1 Tax=Devosia sp. Root635 TaxID=1736575 RepID=UPI0006FC5FE0|nr:fumarylacetoacetate hydrolase family protein [Devosia sp. Root635]KRA55724.1 hypothetical protein ASD80_00090 [Devosia sp. Root635]